MNRRSHKEEEKKAKKRRDKRRKTVRDLLTIFGGVKESVNSEMKEMHS